MTISGHNVVMKRVRIADLKAKLSEHLRAVRRGETIAVLDRDTPIARIVPAGGHAPLRIRLPAPGTLPLNQIRRLEPLDAGLDVVDLLLEERQGNR